MAGTLLPQVAYAAPASSSTGDDKGVVDTFKSWFSDDDDDDNKPPTGGQLEIPSRQKLPKGKKLPKPKRVKELTERRTAQARFWQMSDGRVEADLAAVPVSYKSGKSWKPIDTALHSTKTKGFDFANTANTGQSWFGSDAERLLRFKAPDGRSVTMGLKGAGKSLKPQAKGDTVTYQDAVSGADLQYRVGRGQVKENIVLAQAPSGPVAYTFTLNTDGLTPKARKDGSVALYGELPNTPVMVIPAPYMTDAKKDRRSPTGGTYSTEVSQKLTRDGKNWKLTVTPDAKWLAAKQRQYPVVIDPTITIAPSPTASQDTMVMSDQPAVNFNSSWKLSAGKTDTGIARSLIKFPLTEIPAGTKVDSARLNMYFDQAHTTNANDVTIEAHRATGTWDETTATWNNTSALVGELSGTTTSIDDGDAGTAAVGEWPRGTTTGGAATNDDFAYNKNTATGESYTWQPQVAETASYRVEAHYPAASDAATAAPYTVTHRDGVNSYTLNQTGTAGTWKALDTTERYFAKGNTGKIVLGDTGSSTTRTLADSIRLVNPAQIVKNTGEYNQWHNLAVTDTVQKWVSGTAANYGFVLQAKDDTLAGTLTGGPRYEAGDGSAYGGETSTIPRLTVTYGKVGTSLNSPTVVHSTGPELSWPKYTNSTGDTSLDITEYQLHRSTQQVFTPSAATLVAPVDKAATAYTDTTAVPTPDSSSAEIEKSYYYQLAVKTTDGQLLGSPTRVVGIPKAGRTMKIIQGSQGGVTDTTLSSAQPTVNQDTIQSFGVGQSWLSVGNNSTTYGKTRAVLKFPTTAIPSTATVLENKMYMWGAESTTDTNGAIYELHSLTKDFTETTATWNNATATTPWTTAGGDMSATVSDTVTQVTDVGRHWWDATGLMQSWVKTPIANKGVAVKLKDESGTGPQERTLFLNAEAADPQLRPYMQVIYVDATTEDTYYAPQTPARMTPNSTYTVDFTVTNTTAAAWAAGERELSYTWKLPDGTDVTTGGNQLKTAIPALLPGKSATIKAQVSTPINSDSGNKRTDYVLGWDVRKISDGSWLSAGTGGIPSLKQNVAVEDPTSNQIGLEKFYAYSGKNTGAGSTVMNNLAAGNAVWSYNAFTNPGRGLNTFARFSYNSLDTSDTVLGAGWSGQAAGPIRMGAPLELHPKSNPTEIRLPDGDGTTHVFRKEPDGSWKAPAGVHYKLAPKANLDCTPAKDPIPDAWTMTRPDGTRFLFGCDGYMTSAVDQNGNTQSFTYEERKAHGKPVKFLAYVTDPAGRQTLTLDYYSKGDATYEYIDATGAKVTGTNLNNSKIYDHVKSMTDISGRKVSFYYTEEGLLGQFIDGEGSTSGAPKVFKFTYDAVQGKKNVKLVKATDPRGNATDMAYNEPKAGDDPKYHWWTKAVTDRRNGNTGFAYQVNAANNKFTDTKVTDAEAHASDYVTDDFGRQVQVTNAKSEPAKMNWDADNNVTYLEEANGAKTAFCFDQKTGYPLRQWDAETTKSWTSEQLIATYYCNPANDGSLPNSSKYLYQTRLDGYSADLFTKTSQEGRTWQFGYDSFGNVKTVTDPKGVASSTADDYTTKYDYDGFGQLAKATDANGNATVNSDYHEVGYPKTITDPESHAAKYVYDERGQVTQVADALNKSKTQTYDTFGRPLVSTVPKDQAAGLFITTPAPAYDANDNITKSTAPNGAVSEAVYDGNDLITEASAPANNVTTGRKSTYTYDKVGNLKSSTEPKGSATTADLTDYVTTNNYDATYQISSVLNSDGDKVSYEYDNVGNLVTVGDPKKNATADTTDYTSKTVYDLNHRVVKVTDAAGKYTTIGYDRDSKPKETTDPERNKTETVYDERGAVAEQRVPYLGTTVRTTKFEYDQVGNRTKVVSPRGANTSNSEDFATRTEFDRLNRPVKAYLPYDPADSRYNSPNVYTQTVYDEVGRVKKVSAPPSEGQTVRNDADYTYWDNGWPKTALDPWDIRTAYDYDAMGQQASRTLTSAGGTASRTMNWTYYQDGLLKTRSDAPSAGTERRSFAYAYDANGNTTSIDDTSSGTKVDAYTMTYDGFNQVQKVTEALAGQEKKSTSYAYDANGQPETVTHPDQYSQYTYDLRDLVKTVKVGKSASDAGPKIAEYTYNDRGERLKETKANKNTVDYGYYLNGTLRSTVENKADGTTLVASHTYGYDANGNKSQDVSKKMNADNHSAYLDSTTDYTYDPANRLAKMTKAGNGAGTETYVHDDNANVISQNLKGTTTSFTYDRNRLLNATTGGVLQTYNYDAYGRMDNVTSGGKVLADNTYDGFDHVVEHTKAQPDGTSRTTKYAFDPLDRTTAKTEGTKTTDFNYLGMSGEILDERVAGEITTSYQYSPWGERLSQIKQNSDGTEDLGVYGYNGHTDAETLTDKNGNTASTYGYTAYGSDDTSEFTGIDKPDAAQPEKEMYNSYRFNAKRWDAASGTYDMGFRDYSPGLNRFTSRDMYNGALADMSLGSDPFTGNRYAFTGGNPVSNVEIDGHFFPLILIAIPAVEIIAATVVATVTTAVVVTAAQEAGEAIDGAIEDAGQEDEPTPAPAPRGRPGGDSGSDNDTENKERCDSQPKEERHQYQPTDEKGRAQGASALLCPSDYKPVGAKRSDGGTVNVYGFPEGNNLDSNDNPIYHRSHIIGDKVGGVWSKENLFTGFARMNTSGMRRCEIKMEKQLKAGNWVQYAGKVNYADAGGLAESITMTASTKEGQLFSATTIKNVQDWQTTC
ncbi:DNRLRE domain-containing protein [Streptomyces sp. 21So2-11]|uniref:DNRLRE domain-containing protein n=1 Tax=Streptomyces sp. 21So2-11 TaxID=3144408 RepID=UPI00321AB8B1